MLTKEERTAIETRIKSVYSFNYAAFYESITGERLPSETSVRDDLEKLFPIVLDLCDTSNMIELPLDKDGEVIRAGDTVYDKDGDVAEVGGYYYNNGTCKIIIPYGQNGCYINVHPNEITHKKPVTIASINEQLRHVLDKGHMSSWSMAKLFDIADQLEKLGDIDE